MSYWQLRDLVERGVLCACVPATVEGETLVVEWARKCSRSDLPLVAHRSDYVRVQLAFLLCEEARRAARAMGARPVP